MSKINNLLYLKKLKFFFILILFTEYSGVEITPNFFAIESPKERVVIIPG